MIVMQDASFDEALLTNDLLLVDFWAEWCGPCKMIAPILEEIGKEKAGILEIGKLDVDNNMNTARRFEVMSIPTLILFKKGEPVLRLVGARSKSALMREIETYL
ncbi:MAG: thioredoxin [Nitrospiraceae bacterium]|jgi:thioredoxin 1|nr:thioredoxin [Nitrospiraceae bacterium]MDA8373139.1 thioredoxin [Actinomycetota bacterium]